MITNKLPNEFCLDTTSDTNRLSSGRGSCHVGSCLGVVCGGHHGLWCFNGVARHNNYGGARATVSPPLQGLGVAVGDGLRLAFSYDDNSGSPSIASVGGVLYQLQTYSFIANMDGWAGTLPALIASRTLAETSAATKQSWSRPATVRHHNEWEASAFGLSIITDYASNPGGEAYGWYQYGQARTIEFLLDSVVTVNAAVNVSGPGSLSVVLLAMGAAAGATLRRTGPLAKANAWAVTSWV